MYIARNSENNKMSKKKSKKKEDDTLKVNATLEELLKVAVSGNPKPNKKKAKK